ncbi:MAG: hypothetical protein R3E79_57490 [Caldilineaceae bacterium]
MISRDVFGATGENKSARRTFYEVGAEFILRSASAWKVSSIVLVLLLIAPFFVIAAGLFSALLGKATYLWLTGEDGFAENLQIFFSALTFICALMLIRRYQQAGKHLIVVLYVILCFGLLFLIGEEISWGQRIFGWQTTGVLAEINTQHETNLHNIVGAKTAFKWVQLLIGAYGTLLPLMFGRWQGNSRVKELFAAIIPDYTLIPYFASMFIWKLYRNLLPAPANWEFALAEYNEMLELVLAMGIFLFMIFQLRSDRTSSQRTD